MLLSNNKFISWSEIQKHAKDGDNWVVLYNKVYNLSKFADEHPGGKDIVLQYGGCDATKIFDSIHSKDMLNTLPPDCVLGQIDPSEVPCKLVPAQDEVSSKIVEGKPPISAILNTFDLEAVAKTQMSKEGWDYYSSGADDEVTLRENHVAFQRIWLRPRVMINVKSIDISASILGYPCSFPLYISATAMGKLAHSEGEVVMTRAAHSENIIQMIPTLASCSLDELVNAAAPGQVQFFQLYVNSNRAMTEAIVKKAEVRGCKALFITVDAPQLGRREKDMRNKVTHVSNVQSNSEIKKDKGIAQALSAFIDPSLSWDDLKWFRSITKLPLILKGVQCAEDAVLAAQYGCEGVVLSNHGGRQLDFSRSGIEVLAEVKKALSLTNYKLDIFVDGGIRRGTDIFKALALGAKAVGVGRPALYGMAAYGQQGVERMIQILKEELTVCMRLMGFII